MKLHEVVPILTLFEFGASKRTVYYFQEMYRDVDIISHKILYPFLRVQEFKMVQQCI